MSFGRNNLSFACFEQCSPDGVVCIADVEKSNKKADSLFTYTFALATVLLRTVLPTLLFEKNRIKAIGAFVHSKNLFEKQNLIIPSFSEKNVIPSQNAFPQNIGWHDFAASHVILMMNFAWIE